MRFLQWLRHATFTQALKSQTITTAQTSAAFDTNAYEGDITILVNSAKGTGNADNILTPTITNDDASGGSYSGAVLATGATVLGTGGADKLVTITIPANSGKRYWKVVLTPTGTTPSFVAGATIIGKKRIKA